MSVPVLRYRSGDEDSARWRHVSFRSGDIVISTRSKHGTTWMQLICLMLVLNRNELPAPMAELSPWLDHVIEPVEDVVARLDAQPNRRVVKTHTPLDGLPLDDRAHYVVVARHPLDAAVSLYHQGANIDRVRQAELTGRPVTASRPRASIEEWLADWVDGERAGPADLDSLPGVLHHLGDAWSRREAANVNLVHYDDLSADLDGQMRALAEALDATVDEARWPSLVSSATFAAMRDRADGLAPDRLGILVDRHRFFRRGRIGDGHRLLDDEGLARYRDRCAALAPADLVAWLNRDR